MSRILVPCTLALALAGGAALWLLRSTGGRSGFVPVPASPVEESPATATPPAAVGERAEAPAEPARVIPREGADREVVLPEEHPRLPATAARASGEEHDCVLAPEGNLVRLFGTVRVGDELAPDASIFASSDHGSGFSRTQTDAKGAFELHLASGRSHLAFQQGNALAWSVDVDVPDTEAYRLDVVAPLGRIAGRVTDESGVPLPGIEVEGTSELPSRGSGRTQTDGEGRYTLALPAGRHTVCAGGRRIRGSEYAEDCVGHLEVTEGAFQGGVDLVLERGGIVEGVVRLPEGVHGTEGNLLLIDCSREVGGSARVLGLTGEGGRFTIRGLAPGPLALAVHGRNLATREAVRVEVVAGETTHVEPTLVPARRLEVVTSRGGEPVNAALVLLDARARRLPMLTSVGLAPGRYTLRAELDGRTAEKTFDLPDGSGEFLVELELD